MIDNCVSKKIEKVQVTHTRKLCSLGINVDRKIDINKIVINLSSRKITQKEKEALSLGLDFALPPLKINYVNYFLPIERLCSSLKNCNIYKQDWTHVWHNISALARNSFSQTKYHTKDKNSCKIRTTLQSLKEEDESIVITRPDKGKGIVILDKTDYDNKLHEIVSDTSKFKLIKSDIQTAILKYEDKLNRLLRKIKNNTNDNLSNNLYASGTKPGHLYGIPKIHKKNNPIRPIISSIAEVLNLGSIEPQGFGEPVSGVRQRSLNFHWLYFCLYVKFKFCWFCFVYTMILCAVDAWFILCTNRIYTNL